MQPTVQWRILIVYAQVAHCDIIIDFILQNIYQYTLKKILIRALLTLLKL